MELNEMNLEDVSKRLAELAEEVRSMESVEDIEKATDEKKLLLERKAELVDLEQRTANAVALNCGEVIAENIKEKREELKPMNEEIKVYGTDSKEYRDAFFANLVGKATAEQRGFFADTDAAYGGGIALPVATDVAIWDQVLTAHPILNDVAIVKSGIVMKVSQVTPTNLNTDGGVKGKKDKASVVEMTFTTNEAVLAGKDYSTYVKLSYSEAKMSQGAMEKFLVNEIANALGELLAKDVFARILSDASSNEAEQDSSTPESLYTLIKTALGKATQATNPVIYAPSALYYAILGEVDNNGQPIVRDGVVLGAPLKKDNAATKITVVDPAQFVLNVVADTQIQSQNSVSEAAYIIGGYMRAEGCLRKTNAGAFVTLAS